MREIHRIWDRDWPDRIGSVDYALFSLGKQLEEIRADREHIAGEMSDIVIIAFKWLADNDFDPEKTILNRLAKRHKGHTKEIADKYEKMWIKGSDAGPPNNELRPDVLAISNVKAALIELQKLDSIEEFSAQTKIMLKMKLYRIINDSIDIMQKMKLGKKADLDLASEMVKAANKLEEIKTSEVALLRHKRRYPKRR